MNCDGSFHSLQLILLTNFKHGPEQEDCPVPDDVRETLQEFHNDLLAHCGGSHNTGY